MTVGPTIGPSFGATYGATYGPSYGATYGNTIGPGYGAVYNLVPPLPPGGAQVASQGTSKITRNGNAETPSVETGKVTKISPQLRNLARDLGF
ncbi:hypothetical protein RvY_05671 [Ramazzottius varieornatus]|uniref:Uncharacterized protein n=1 Tax=Ramazzottius varieornatus TaxID=947166 RepID=A0A1D1UZF1_RAMVA|nr:hypothetical protein RvY_05671 [Ramazzottius varieornatus]